MEKDKEIGQVQTVIESLALLYPSVITMLASE